MADYKKAEIEAINAAWFELLDLCESTNWADKPTIMNALRLEKVEMNSLIGARAMVVIQWARGLDNKDKPASDLYFIRPGALAAFMVGVRHAVERVDHSYCGPKVTATRALCDAVKAAQNAHTTRIEEA